MSSLEMKTEGSSHEASLRAETAAQYVAFEKSLTVSQTIRLYWRSILWVLYGLALVFGYGIDGNVAANLLAMPRFRIDYGQALNSNGTVTYVIPAAWLSLFTGISQLCAIIGALGAGWLADRIGRKYTALLSCVVSIGGVAAQYASRGSLGILAAGKAINGVPTGMWLVIGPLYASETAPLKLRSVLIATTNIVSLSGVLLFTGVVYAIGASTTADAYRVPLACQWIIPGLVLLTGLLWPESPVWLVRMGKTEAAMHSIRMLYGNTKHKIDGEALLASIQESIAREQAISPGKASYRECFSTPRRRDTLVCMFVYACQFLSGVVLVQGYQAYMYELLGYTAQDALLLGLLNIAVQWVANVCSWFLIPTIGPRALLVWGQLLAAITLFVIGGACTGNTEATQKVAVGFMFIWGVIYQCSVGATSWTVVGELPVLRLRSKTQALSNMTLNFFQWLIGFVFPYMFNPDAGNLAGKTALVFGGTTLVGFIGTYLFLPDTRRR